MSQERRKLRVRKGQTILEYSLLLGIVAMVAVSMAPMLRRAAQGMIKLTADQVGVQTNADQLGGKYGYMRDQSTNTTMDQVTRVREFMGTTEYSFDGSLLDTDMSSSADLGFQKQAVK